MKTLVELVPLCPDEQFTDQYTANGHSPSLTLRQFLLSAPALSTKPLDAQTLDTPMSHLRVTPVGAQSDQPLFRPPEVRFALSGVPSVGSALQPSKAAENDGAQAHRPAVPEEPVTVGRPTSLTEAEAVKLAYWKEIKSVASFLQTPVSPCH